MEGAIASEKGKIMNDFKFNAIMKAYIEREGITGAEMQRRISEIAKTLTDGVDYSTPTSSAILEIYKSKNPTQYEELKSNPILLGVATDYYNKEAVRIRKLLLREIAKTIGITNEDDLSWAESQADE